MKILVVDNDHLILEFMSDMLSKKGWIDKAFTAAVITGAHQAAAVLTYKGCVSKLRYVSFTFPAYNIFPLKHQLLFTQFALTKKNGKPGDSQQLSKRSDNHIDN